LKLREQDKAQFGSLIGAYLKVLNELGEEKVEELTKQAHENMLAKMQAVKPVVVDWELLKEIVPEKMPDEATVKQEIHALYCNLPLSFSCRYNDAKIEYSQGSEMPIEGHWTGDWFDNYFNIELKRGEFVIRSNRQFEKVNLYFSSDGKGYLELQDAESVFRQWESNEPVWVPLTNFVCNLHFLGE